ncbi:MAG: CoA transferase [Deltaproteobacteria bacterium]|nr:CoA transferase [Deltaproteobacteria bacterium]MBW2359598.1 CoA transferase [Deltaproteobacteria bacterium]
MSEDAAAATGPCSGLRVLDLSTVISGPYCTQALGDLGADVIKVEPPTGDSSRHSGAPFREPGFSGMLAQFNRNKRSIVLDLHREEARQVAHALAKRADVFVQNFRPGVAERLGLGWDVLRAINPRLVYISISGFGPDGPYVDLPAYDHVVQALGGQMPTQGGDGPPKLVQGGIADKTTGMTALSATLAALLAREREGLGQKVEVPMLDAFAAVSLPEAMVSRSFPPLASDAPGVGEFFRTFATADGYVVGLTVQDAQYRGLCEALGLHELAEDERFAQAANRFANYRELVAILETEIRKWPTAKFIAGARASGAPFAPAYDVEDFLSDPQVEHNRTVEDVEDARFGTTRYLRHPARYERTPASLRRHAPRLGEHTDELLTEAGFSADEIARLRDAGAVR